MASRSLETALCLSPAPGGTHLPVLSDSIPHSHFPCMTRGDQLVPDEEERVHRNAKAEHALSDRGKRGG